MSPLPRGTGQTGGRSTPIPSLNPPAPPIVEPVPEAPKGRKSLREILQAKKPHKTYPLCDT